MAVNTEFLGSDLTQQFTGSDASFAGQLYAAGAVRLASTLSVVGTTTLGAVTVAALTPSSVSATGAIAGTNIRATSSVAIGGSNTSLTFASGSSTTLVGLTIPGSSSISTTLSWNSVAANDIVLLGPSSIQSDVILQGYASANSVITFQYSTTSTEDVATSAINCRFLVLRTSA